MRLHLLFAGFGNVARRFARLLDDRREALLLDHDIEPHPIGFATRRNGLRFDPAGIDLNAAAVVEQAPPPGSTTRTRGEDPVLQLVDAAAATRLDGPIVLIETTTLNVADGEPSATYIRRAFAAGMHVVTANKGPVACAYDDLAADARKAGVTFFFEGAVMDGVPIFNLFRETLPAVGLLGFRGVVNTTTNHIIAAMEDGRPFDEALAAMQREGIAEADATLDVDGWDAAAKTAALMNVLMGARTRPSAIARQGIGHLTPDDVRAARLRGERLKLVASAARTPDGPAGRVAVESLPASDPLASLAGMANAIAFQTELLDTIVVTERHGGLTQTAYALLSDLVAVRRAIARSAR